MIKNIFSTLLITLIFAGCIKDIPTPNERKSNILSLIETKNYQTKIIKTSNFNLFTIENIKEQCSDIKVYIEGDGLAWITKSIVSDNPTPLNPIGLKLMNIDNSSCKVYIARPCQYVDSINCNKKYWTSHRFNHMIIESFNEALNKLKVKNKNNSFSLIGYSGGAAIALLSASKRNDVKTIITVAGNIDTSFWTKYHNITPLSGSLNPADYTKELSQIVQYHLIGTSDRIIPQEVFSSYKLKFNNQRNIKHFIYDLSHTKNWENNYKKFLEKFKVN